LLSELKNSKGVGIDISKNAVLIAKKNAKRHKMQHNTNFFNKSLASNFIQKFDLIVSNPPYIMSKDIKNLNDDIKKYEPRIALDGGNDGLDLIKKIIYKTKNILKFKGKLALEIGNEQNKKVSTILEKNNFKIEHAIKDYKDNVRCVISTYLNN
jgi:release factor glutamine methyltransferase